MTATELVDKAVAAFNQHDPSLFTDVYAEEAVVVDPTYPDPLRGVAAIRRDFSDFVSAFPDLTNTVNRVIGDGDTVVAEGEIAGTHQGPLPLPDGDLPATGRKVRMPFAVVMRADDGHIVEEHRYYDVAGLQRQLSGSS